MRFGVRGDPDREVADATDQLHQLDGVVQLAGREVEVLGRVTPEGEDVVDAGVAVADDDVDQLGARVRGTGEMGHRGHRRVGVDRDDEVVGAFAGGAPRAVGDRDVRRLERLEIAQRLREHALHLLVAGREELEREARTGLQDLVDLQGASGYRGAPGRNPRNRRNRSELPTTNTLEHPIAVAAITGLRSPTAANGMAATL